MQSVKSESWWNKGLSLTCNHKKQNCSRRHQNFWTGFPKICPIKLWSQDGQAGVGRRPRFSIWLTFLKTLSIMLLGIFLIFYRDTEEIRLSQADNSHEMSPYFLRKKTTTTNKPKNQKPKRTTKNKKIKKIKTVVCCRCD